LKRSKLSANLDRNNRYSILSTFSDVEEVSIGNKSDHFYLPITLQGKNRKAEVKALVDSGASTLFLSENFVKKHGVVTQPLGKEIPVRNIDGSNNASGPIKCFAELTL